MKQLGKEPEDINTKLANSRSTFQQIKDILNRQDYCETEYDMFCLEKELYHLSTIRKNMLLPKIN